MIFPFIDWNSFVRYQWKWGKMCEPAVKARLLVIQLSATVDLQARSCAMSLQGKVSLLEYQ